MKKHLVFAKILARFLDEQFKIGTFSFGVDPLLDLIPGIGGAIGLILSLYIIWIGLQLKLPQALMIKMIVNVLFDFLLGLIPLLGWAGDVVFKANVKNIAIIENYSASVVEAEIISSSAKK